MEKIIQVEEFEADMSDGEVAISSSESDSAMTEITDIQSLWLAVCYPEYIAGRNARKLRHKKIP